MAYAVARRVREIGIRVAVGSTAGAIVRLVLRDSLKLVGFGLVLGIPAALAAMRVLAGFAYELSPADPVSLIAAVAVLVTIALVAAAGPAARAARVDPVVALRAE
jgi:ABC-type antimicrobial peptide transport system permease subunit